MFRDETDITYGIEATVWKAVEKAIDKNSKETFIVLNKFMTNIILLAVKKDSLKHFDIYILRYGWYYSATFARARSNTQLAGLHRYASETGCRQLKEILNYYLRYDKNDIEKLNYEKLQHQNRFIYCAFNSFSSLFYNIVNNGDTSFYDYALNQFNQLDLLSYNNFNNLATRIKFYPEETEEFAQQKKLYEVVSQYQDYKRHVLTGIKYWSYFMYSVGRNSLEATKLFIENLFISAESNELLREIIYLRNQGYTNYFGWEWWDFKERLDGQSYSPPSPREWLSLGFLIDLIREGRYYFDPNVFDAKELEQISFLSDTIKDLAKVLSTQFDKWHILLKVESREDLEAKLAKIIEVFNQLSEKSITVREEAIKDSQISDAKVAAFRDAVGKKWESYSVIRKLFIKHGNRKTDQPENLTQLGYQNRLFGRAKTMFIDGGYGIDPTMISDYGGEVAREIDDLFISNILSAEPTILSGKNIRQCIDASIAHVRENEGSPDVIIVPSEYSYSDKDFLNHPEFIVKRNLPQEDNQELLMIGTYFNIPVYSCFSEQINSKVIVCNFPESFTMRYGSNESWYNNELQVTVNLVTDQQAEAIYNKNPDGWRYRNGLKELSQEEAITGIKNGIYLTVTSYYAFDICAKDRFVVGIIGKGEE